MKHLKHLFTALLLLCTTMATAHDFEVGGIYYNITDATNKTVSVTYKGDYYESYNEYTGSVVIPESVTYNGTTYSVTSIGNYAFRDCSGLTSITIPNSVTSIEYYVFGDCTGLTSIEIPNSVTSIGNYAFCGCTGLTSIVIPNSVTSIGGFTFSGCTGLTSIVIGNSVTSIGNYAFRDCSGLTSVEFNAENCTTMGSSSYPVFSNCTTLSTVTIGENVKNIPNYAFYKRSGLTSIVIGNSVTSIGDFAFRNCSGLTSVEIPNSVTSIGASAFNGCSGLTSVVIGNSVTSIGYNVFSGCTGLKTVYNFSNFTFSKGSSNDGYVAYYADKVYNLPNGSKEGDFIFDKPNDVNTLLYYLGNDAELTLPADYKGENYVIGTDVFKDNTTITSVKIPSSVTSIGHNAFSGCTGLKTVYNFSNLTFSKGSSNNGYVAYYAGKVYNAPNGFIDGEFIWYENEYGMTLAGYLGNATELAMPTDYNGKSVTSIGDDAFEHCTGLTSITIPNSVTYIGNQAFYNCSELNEVHISDLTAWCNISFGSSNANPLYYAKKLYLNDELITELTIPNSVRNIRNYAFYNCSGLTSIEIPNSVTSIGGSAFSGCTGLTSIEIPNSVTSIGGSAFSGCTGLRSIEIPNSVTSIGDEAFSGCTGLEKVCINDLSAWCSIDFGSADANPLYYVGNLYLNGELLTELSIPAEIAEVKDYAFYNCKGVTNIDIVDGVESIGNSAFYGCSDLETLYISNTIESIGDYAFAECNNILDIKIGSKKAITASENIFSSDAYNNACLYVPTGRKDFYAKTSPWSNFIISEMDFTGIDDMEAEGERVKDVYYDLSGRAIESPTTGVYIVNGKKVVIK